MKTLLCCVAVTLLLNTEGVRQRLDGSTNSACASSCDFSARDTSARDTSAHDTSANASTYATNAWSSDLDPIAIRFLIEMWDKNTKNREGSEALFDRQNSPNEQVLMAYTLNRMKHNRYRDARVPAGALTVRYPANLDGWILRIWLDTVTNQYDSGLLGMQLMKRQMDKQPDLTDAKKDQYNQRLARIIGYLQGPVARRTDQTTLNDTITKIVDGMTAEQLKKFNDQRNAVLTEFDQYVKDAGELEKQEKQTAAAAVVVETDAIQAQNQTLGARLQNIQPEKDRLRLDAEQKSSVVESQLSPLRQELASVIGAIQAIEGRLQLAYQDRSLELILLSRQEDVTLRALIFRRINRIDRTINTIESELFAANAAASSLQIQVNQLASELARINQDLTNGVDRLTREESQANKQQRRNASRLVKLAKGSNATTAKVRSAENEIESLRTYDPFPIELARQDYLDTFSATQ